MKLLLILCFVLLSSAAFSQTYKKYVPDVSPKFPLYRHDLMNKILVPFYDTLPRFKTLASPYKKNGGIVYLPQDNMPCIVPPAVAPGQIPNYWQPQDHYRIHSIPNLAEPFKLEDN